MVLLQDDVKPGTSGPGRLYTACSHSPLCQAEALCTTWAILNLSSKTCPVHHHVTPSHADAWIERL